MSESEENSSSAAGGPDKETMAKRAELREIKSRLKEIREIMKYLGDKRKEFDARETALSAELGRAVKVRKGGK
jgi:hypothetical protein